MNDDDRSGAGDGESGGGGRIRPHVHAHDEFELDIDVETDLTRVAPQRRPVADLFDDDSEITEEVTEIAAEHRGGQQAYPELNLPLPRASNEEVLPLFLSSERPGPEPPAPPLPAADAAPVAGPPDLSALLGPPADDDSPPPGDALFEDVSGIHDLPPVHDRGYDSSSSPEVAPPPPDAEPKPRFAADTTGGLPLDGTQFEPAPGPERKRRGGQADSVLLRRGPMRMAGSQRMVRRWLQPSLRDVLLMLLLILLGVGLWIGWSFHQDYRKRADWEQFDQSREQLERTRTDAIKKRQPKKEQDVP